MKHNLGIGLGAVGTLLAGGAIHVATPSPLVDLFF